MNISDLQRYKRFYRSANRMGAGRIFNQYFGLDEDQVVPLSISHGVDFGHCYGAMEVQSVEPIHWSYSEHIHRDAIRVKPSVLVPHPWAMKVFNSTPPQGEGVLVIGPPPGPENDQALYELIKDEISDNWSILIKQRGEFEGSIAFWRERGLQPVTAGGPDLDFYDKLYNLLSTYETIKGCTFSSALIFAASIGKKVEPVEGYWHRTYDVAEYERKVNWQSTQAKHAAKVFLSGDQKTIKLLSRELLGFDLKENSRSPLLDLERKIEILCSPFHLPNCSSTTIKLRFALAQSLRRPNLLLLDAKKIKTKLLQKRQVVEMNINEFATWAESPTTKNVTLTPVKYVKGKTEPGLAVISY